MEGSGTLTVCSAVSFIVGESSTKWLLYGASYRTHIELETGEPGAGVDETPRRRADPDRWELKRNANGSNFTAD